MADQNINVSSPVKIVSDSNARVAFELMIQIDNYDQNERKQKNKEYWLKLYRQCYKATNGAHIENILQEV